MFQANARLQQASSAAVSALVRVMMDPSTPASARVRAADCILARGNQGLENEDLNVRLAALERAAELAKAAQPHRDLPTERLTFRAFNERERQSAEEWEAVRDPSAPPPP